MTFGYKLICYASITRWQFSLRQKKVER